jgi:N-acetyl-gamma-glutamyl-phosphate reductase
MLKVKVVGSSGYGGVGITELLLKHPETEIACLVSPSDAGRTMSEVYPHLAGWCDLPIVAPDDPSAQQDFDVVFFSTPDRVGMHSAARELERGAKVIDYSGDFRFNAADRYAGYARFIGKDPEHAAPELLPQTVYGLPELHREALKTTRLAGNPGCFAVSCILGLAPAVQAGAVNLKSLICDCKTGVSGAGKKPNPAFHYPARYEQMNAYKLAGHQHTVEVERELSRLAGDPLQVTFTAQVVPICRGILSCLYADLDAGQTYADVLKLYRAFYADEPFVSVHDRSAALGVQQVRGTNRCMLTVDVDERNGRLRVISHIDNLMKGQAGSALQNMNLMTGLEETLGLDLPGQYP